MLFLLIPFAVAAVITLYVVHSSTRHGHLSADHDLSGPQKFHARPVPRIGGVGIFAGLASMVLAAHYLQGGVNAKLGALLLLCGLPAFGAGLIEDFTKRVSPGKRLLATAVSAALGVFVLGAAITRTDIPGLDLIVGTAAGAFIATVFTVAGVANSVNIIDGFNGLSSMCVSLMLLTLAYVAYQVGDTELALWALAGVGAILGFFVWNYPSGMIFLGDGGAYFMGFYLAEMGILLISRHSEVSPLFALMVCIYPVFETLFSIYRRRVLRDVSPGAPDGIHLHSLIYRRLMRWAIGARDARAMTRRNSMTAPYLWTLCISSLAPALLFWDSTPMILACMVLFGVIYVGLYWRIVRFRTPKWMVFRGDPRKLPGNEPR
ncbi:MraY family glycosyltransferase [Roseateles terrae]|uniref:UDP-N-acetylmuramyl pentapeptide phosphotransferase/UDP-N-acetylglucosamine-1-phosphate transferase n=1 Tax=Roseateles terrae TaxID=431060 RepID=A0ABR6GSR2_9BURK|nr:glycosyltransferase [Roseateles terrae]MBB3195155.1 UDP-N-acetylmuramyl pentapeptide phosphotransferase/UDP-N-acetylglucosamine-1-phosphate transferase [Roseateles terrae]OWQ87177.1 glycosyl transferase [Roseateles terrae]